jgi:hypothetical protein
MVNIEEIDASLTMLSGAVAAQANILLEVEHSPGRALLDPTELTGLTRRRVTEMLAVLADIWQAYAALKDVVDRSRTLRGRRGRADGRLLAELESLLHGPSVPAVLPPVGVRQAEHRWAGAVKGGAVKTGVQPAEPLSAEPLSAGWIRPDELARRLDHRLGAVRAELATVLGIWNRQLAVAAEAQQSLADIDRVAFRLGLDPDDAGVTAAHRLADDLAAQVRSDPLAVPERTVARTEAAVDAVGRAVGDLARRHDNLAADLRVAHRLLAGIISLDDTARRDAHRAWTRIRRPGTLLRLEDGWLDDRRRGLGPWLDRLDGQAAVGRWKEASRGLARWREAAEATRRTAARIAETNGAGLRRRDELRGLLGAWQAKATRLGLADHAGLRELAGRAQHALLAVPSDVDVAAWHVEAYGRLLSALSTSTARVDGALTGGPAARTGSPAARTGSPAARTGGPAARTGGPAGVTGGPAGVTGNPAGITGGPAGQAGDQPDSGDTGSPGTGAGDSGTGVAAAGSSGAGGAVDASGGPSGTPTDDGMPAAADRPTRPAEAEA